MSDYFAWSVWNFFFLNFFCLGFVAAVYSIKVTALLICFKVKDVGGQRLVKLNPKFPNNLLLWCKCTFLKCLVPGFRRIVYIVVRKRKIMRTRRRKINYTFD